MTNITINECERDALDELFSLITQIKDEESSFFDKFFLKLKTFVLTIV